MTTIEKLKLAWNKTTEEKRIVLLERFGGDCFEDIAEELEANLLFGKVFINGRGKNDKA